MVNAVKYIGAMKKGETKPQLFECDNGKRYVVKFMSNPVGKKILVHEYIANELAVFLKLPVAEGQLIYFSKRVIESTPEIGVFNVEPGFHFGCEYYENKARPTNEKRIKKCRNLDQVPGIIVFDHWVRNRDRCGNFWNLIIDEGELYNTIYMIDHAGCFFSDLRNSKLLKDCADYMDVFWGEMYQQFKPFIKEKNLFYKYIKAIEEFPDNEIKKIVHSTPSAWEPDKKELDALAEYLIKRKLLVKKPIQELMNKFI